MVQTKINYLPLRSNSKLIRTDDDIKDAVQSWLSNPKAALEKYGNISCWDTSNVSDMSGLFDLSRFDDARIEKSLKEFNDDLSKWDVSNVKFMIGMFFGCIAFNQNLNNWNVSNVVDMNSMFAGCTSFNGKIGNWDVSNLQNIDYTFSGCSNFNQDIGNWNVSTVLNSKYTFQECTIFNNGGSDSIKTWDMSAIQGVKIFEGMFYECKNFNQDIRSWKMPPQDNDFNEMFNGATKFLNTYQNSSGWEDFDKGTPSLKFFTSDSKPDSDKVKGLTKKYIDAINGSNLSTSQRKMAVRALTVLYTLTGVAVADSAATDVIRGLRILQKGDCRCNVVYKYLGEEKIPCKLKAILIILKGLGVGSILPNIINDIVELTVKPIVKRKELGDSCSWCL
jgi:surface protein